MTTVSEILNKLALEGYTEDFNIRETDPEDHINYLKSFPADFKLDRSFRFEGPTDPADQAIIYAVSSEKHNLKGTLINGYGIYADSKVDEVIKALSNKENNV